MNAALHDCHVHLGFARSPRRLAAQAQAAGGKLFAQTVEPPEFVRLVNVVGDCASVRLGLGLHPWWVLPGQQGSAQLDSFLQLLPSTRFVGEIGLDLSSAHAATAAQQQAVLECVLLACAKQQDCVISLHCVRAADAVCDLLERTGCSKRNAVVWHWFSGSSDQLVRARSLGCWFSVGQRMLATKRGRAYVRAMPANRLLLETDLPHGDPAHMPVDLLFSAVQADLQQAGSLLAQQVGQDGVWQAQSNAARLLG